jgi:hypothetical protein
MPCLSDSDGDGVIEAELEDELFFSNISDCSLLGGTPAHDYYDAIAAWLNNINEAEFISQVEAALAAEQHVGSERTLRNSSIGTLPFATSSLSATSVTEAMRNSSIHKSLLATPSSSPSAPPAVFENGRIPFPIKTNTEKNIPKQILDRIKRLSERLPPYDPEQSWVCRHIAGYIEMLIRELSFTSFKCIEVRTLPYIDKPIGLKRQIRRASELLAQGSPEQTRKGLEQLGLMAHTVLDYHFDGTEIAFLEPEVGTDDGTPIQFSLDLNKNGLQEDKEVKRISATKVKVCWIESFTSVEHAMKSPGQFQPGEKCKPPRRH